MFDAEKHNIRLQPARSPACRDRIVSVQYRNIVGCLIHKYAMLCQRVFVKPVVPVEVVRRHIKADRNI